MSTPNTNDINPVFLEQARNLCLGGELLPGGVNALAAKLQNAAETQTPLRIKLGLDPTRPDLHLGHTVVLRKLRAFQNLGHQAVLLIGDATAMIGDPSGRNVTRPPLTEEEILQNAQTYLDQASQVVDVRKAEIVRNNDWFKAMNLQDFLKLAASTTVAQLLARDDFAKRYQQQTPIALHELFYPLMQAYDSVMVQADIELGGTDQRFNNLLGRDLQQAYVEAAGGKQQLVLLMPLLEGTDGKIKMSKSYPENCVNLTDSAEEMFGKLMSIPDELIIRYEELLTPLTAEQIDQHRQLMATPLSEGGVNPRDMKASVAKWIITQYHSHEAAEAAEAAFVAQFRNKKLPDTMPEITLKAGEAYPLLELMVKQQLARSKSEARRLVQGGGVKLNGEEKLMDPDWQLKGHTAESFVLQVGKRRFCRFHFE